MNFRNNHSESPKQSDPQIPTRRRGRPKGSRSSQVPSAGIAEIGGHSFPHIPVELWKQVSEAANMFVRTIGAELNAAYAQGIESKMVHLLDEALPEAALALGRATLEAFARRERGFHGTTIRCHLCSGCLEYQGDVRKILKTRIGKISPRRAYYHGTCGHSAAPLDILLGVDGVHAVLPSLQDTVAWLSASMSYPEVVKLLDRLYPSKFSLKSVEKITATLATQVENQLLEESYGNRRFDCDDSLQPGVAVVEVDGGFVLVRDHTEASREFKLAVLGRLPDDTPGTSSAEPGEVDRGVKLLEKSFVGHFADPDQVFSSIHAEYCRRGLDKLKVFHGISDGGSWIMPRMPFLAEEGQEISLVLDWWHADERLAQIANTLHGAGTQTANDWRTNTRADLWCGRLEEFLSKLEQAARDGKTAAARKELQGHHAYFAARRHLLRYQECRDRGLPIGSGAIEGGIRFIGKDRLNRSGMRWNIRGAERILQLRCVKYSDRWQELAEKRVAKRAGFYQRVRTAWYKAA